MPVLLQNDAIIGVGKCFFIELELSKSHKVSQIKAKRTLICVTDFRWLVLDGSGNRIFHKTVISALNSRQR